MRGYWLVLLLFAIRYGLLALVNSSALSRAAHYAPLDKSDQFPYLIYQVSSVLIPAYMCFLLMKVNSPVGIIGLIVLSAGIILFTLSVIQFALTPANSISQKGVYLFCRHPMYAAYFLYFIGSALLASSWVLLTIVVIFQMSAHRLILSEERWCLLTFGQAYDDYMKNIGRYMPKLQKRNKNIEK